MNKQRTEHLMTVTMRVHRFSPQPAFADEPSNVSSAGSASRAFPLANSSSNSSASAANQTRPLPRRHHRSNPFASVDAQDISNSSQTSSRRTSVEEAAVRTGGLRQRHHSNPFQTASTNDENPRSSSENSSASLSGSIGIDDTFDAATVTEVSTAAAIPTVTAAATAENLNHGSRQNQPSALGQIQTETPVQKQGISWVQEYEVTVPKQETLLNVLLMIKRQQDPGLAFRYSCGHGMCGSDAVRVNGAPTLLCTATVEYWAKDAAENGHRLFRRTIPAPAQVGETGEEETLVGKTRIKAEDTKDTRDAQSEPSDGPAPAKVIDISPLAGFPILKDLIVDIDPMLEAIKRFQPYLQATGQLKTTESGKIDAFEYLQSPQELTRFEQLSTCISCGVCEGACPIYSGGEAFVGPAALVHEMRFIEDSRDQATEKRWADLGASDALSACQSVRACSLNCPQGIDVGEVIWQAITKKKRLQNQRNE